MAFMTREEQDARLGRLVREIQDKERELVCLERKAIQVANAFHRVTSYMHHAADRTGDFTVNPPLAPEPSEFLNLNKALALAAEIVSVRADLRKLNEQKKEASF